MAHHDAHHGHLDHNDDRPFVVRLRALASRRVLAGVVLAITAFTVIGLTVLWPGDTEPVVNLEGEDYFGERVEAAVTSVETADCSYASSPGEFVCDTIAFEVSSGSPAGDTDLLEVPHGIGGPTIHDGDHVILYYSADAPSGAHYQFADFQRRAPLTWLAVAFFLVVVAFGRWRGLFAILGVGVSMLVLIGFMLPALLENESPIWVALVGTCAVALPALFLAHGISERTSVAVIGTVSSLLFICVLGLTFVHLSHLTGLGDEEVGFLQAFGGDLDFAGLLLAGLVIGALGVLDDVTVTQVAAVWELRVAQPAASTRELYRAGVRIGPLAGAVQQQDGHVGDLGADALRRHGDHVTADGPGRHHRPGQLGQQPRRLGVGHLHGQARGQLRQRLGTALMGTEAEQLGGRREATLARPALQLLRGEGHLTADGGHLAGLGSEPPAAKAPAAGAPSAAPRRLQLLVVGQRDAEGPDHGIDQIGDHRLDGVGHQLRRSLPGEGHRGRLHLAEADDAVELDPHVPSTFSPGHGAPSALTGLVGASCPTRPRLQPCHSIALLPNFRGRGRIKRG